ncbi:hypothetical protein BD626DRAFT_481606 [Schizophyllum amplum]|uniref:Uncharacterized protein n=1 Tax=Schizophyllum amplum TaxID=97359 RepID=A0A550CUE0_9AGAR|nr:hypothetical protein BD626DRAFT_481606 [Auriculariopsis ampla]
MRMPAPALRALRHGRPRHKVIGEMKDLTTYTANPKQRVSPQRQGGPNARAVLALYSLLGTLAPPSDLRNAKVEVGKWLELGSFHCFLATLCRSIQKAFLCAFSLLLVTTHSTYCFERDNTFPCFSVRVDTLSPYGRGMFSNRMCVGSFFITISRHSPRNSG